MYRRTALPSRPIQLTVDTDRSGEAFYRYIFNCPSPKLPPILASKRTIVVTGDPPSSIHPFAIFDIGRFGNQGKPISQFSASGVVAPV